MNIDSPIQLRKLLYEDWGLPQRQVTAKGVPSTAKLALEELEGDPRVRLLMEYRHLKKAWSAYYKPLYERIGKDGRLHAHFSSTRTVTGRLSCTDPNLMTIPRSDTLAGVRDVFVPHDGYELWEYDLSQAELRVQASLCRDTALMAALEAGEDLHGRTAQMVFGEGYTALQRRLAKALNFGFSYGVGPRKFATQMVMGTPETVTECDHWNHPWGVPGRPHKLIV